MVVTAWGFFLLVVVILLTDISATVLIGGSFCNDGCARQHASMLANPELWRFLSSSTILLCRAMKLTFREHGHDRYIKGKIDTNAY